MLPQKVKNELKKALQYVETETDNNITDYLETTTEEYYNNLTLQNSFSDEEYVLHLTEDEIEESTIEDLWNEVENYVDYFKKRNHVVDRKPEGNRNEHKGTHET